MMGSDRLHLIHCEECLRSIETFTRGGRGEFMASRMQQDAVLWNLEMAHRCAKSVSDEEKQKHPTVDWGRLRILCQNMLDGEHRADVERVWEITQPEVPGLQRQLRMVLTSKA